VNQKVENTQEYMILNIGTGVQVGSAVVVLAVTETIEAAKEFIRNIGATHGGKIAVVKKETVITRTPVVDLKESNESVLLKPKA
jgi:hypothetical protein